MNGRKLIGFGNIEYTDCDEVQEKMDFVNEWGTENANCDRKSLSFLRQDDMKWQRIEDDLLATSFIVGTTSFISHQTLAITNGFVNQMHAYLNTIDMLQSSYNQQTMSYLQRVEESGAPLTATNLRDKSTWTNVKQLVVREELMKLQVSGKTDLPFDADKINEIREKIKDVDLSKIGDSEVNKIIEEVLNTDKQSCLDAFKLLKQDGEISSILQDGKIEQLKAELEKIDLNRITAKELKHLIDNYIDKLELHHRTSISSDPTQQSNADNIDTLSTTEHNKKHTNPDSGRIDYTKETNEKPLDRKGEIKDGINGKIVKNHLQGLAAAVGIAAGIGFSLGFITTLAQSGVSPETIKYAFAVGGKSAIESGVMGGIGYEIGQTIGGKLANSLADAIVSKLGSNITHLMIENIGKMCSMGVIGSLMIVVSSVYQFCKLKHAGYSTKECMIRVGKSAMVSIGVLALSIAAQGIWGGYAGLIVSITASVIITSISIGKQIHNKKVLENVQKELVEMHYKLAMV